MKIYDTHFDDYIESNKQCDLHPKLEVLYKKFPASIHNFRNLIFYGPKGVGKYTQMLKSIKRYSQSELKYEKKIIVSYNKSIYYFKISDIHFEIDMSLLGCQSKMLWNEIYYNILDIVSAKVDKIGIIVCKNFHEIHGELLDTFYSYMQTLNQQAISLKFILLTEEISFIPDNILNCCEIIRVARPTKTLYTKCIKTKLPTKLETENITNIKNLHLYNEDLMLQYRIICNKILYNLLNVNDLQYLKFRDILYDIFIYNLDITDCIWYILSTLVKQKRIKREQMSDILVKTYSFFQYYNNNYRPIYHVENYLLYLAKLIHGF